MGKALVAKSEKLSLIHMIHRAEEENMLPQVVLRHLGVHDTHAC